VLREFANDRHLGWSRKLRLVETVGLVKGGAGAPHSIFEMAQIEMVRMMGVG
jgi:hypothetical protein